MPAAANFATAPIAFAGIRRDEATALPHWYYENLAAIGPGKTVVIVDPMLATGGSACEAAKKARELTRRKSVLESNTLPGKLADCSEKTRRNVNCFLSRAIPQAAQPNKAVTGGFRRSCRCAEKF